MTKTTETPRQKADRLDRNIPGYLNDRDIERLLEAFLRPEFINKLKSLLDEPVH